MKKFLAKTLAVFLSLIGIGAAAAAVYLCMNYLDAKPMLLTPPDVARSKVIMLLNAVSDGDYDEASQSIYGTPSLGVEREAATEVGALIWAAFQDSFAYELVGECYTTEQGLAQDVVVTCLDMTSVTEQLRERSQPMLEQRVADAKNMDDIYDENNEYREEFVMDVLYDAASDALEENTRELTMELTINLSYQNGKWWVIADEALLDAISGGILY